MSVASDYYVIGFRSPLSPFHRQLEADDKRHYMDRRRKLLLVVRWEQRSDFRVMGLSTTDYVA